ncbi:hypothetical protein DMH17_06690 [Raoultella planticola]|nr:hypothetical protein [Raoultella planticola]
MNAVTGHLPPVAPEVMAAADAGTEADRKAAVALAVGLMEKTRPATGNAYLTRKGLSRSGMSDADSFPQNRRRGLPRR